jgi:DNA-binding transcriptional LysR family regulator
VLAGLGIAQLPATRHVLEHVERGELVLVLPDWSAGELPIQVLWPRHRRLPARVRAFIDWVVDVYAHESALVADRIRRLPAEALHTVE